MDIPDGEFVTSPTFWTGLPDENGFLSLDQSIRTDSVPGLPVWYRSNGCAIEE